MELDEDREAEIVLRDRYKLTPAIWKSAQIFERCCCDRLVKA